MPNKTLTLTLTGEETFIDACMELYTSGYMPNSGFTNTQLAEKKFRRHMEEECKNAAKRQAIVQAQTAAEAQTTNALTEITLVLSD